MEEIMIDNIKAASAKKAHKVAVANATRYLSYKFQPAERPTLPSVKVIDCVRLKDGKPVRSDFDTKAKIHLSSITPAEDKPPTPPKPRFKAVPLEDPFTDDILKLIKE
jgi:hypothetical protein